MNRGDSGLFSSVLKGAASSAISVALELEAVGRNATPEAVACTIGAVLLKEYRDKERIGRFAVEWFPLVRRELTPPQD